MIPMGLAEATTVRVGHALGRGDASGERRAAFAGYALALATQSLSALVLLTGNHALVALYTHDAAVAALAASLLLYAAAFQFPDGIQVLSAGALRGLRDTRVPMFLAALAYWGIGMPLGAGLGLWLGWGPRGMWIGLIAGLTVAAVLLCRRFLRSSALAVGARAPNWSAVAAATVVEGTSDVRGMIPRGCAVTLSP
jgi:MATE family multidrug resistance protein